MPFDRRRSGVPIDEFRALVSASFDNIGDSHLDLSPAPVSHTNHASYMHPLLENDEPPADEDATPRPARPVSGGSRRSAFSFLRKVKTSATSAVHDAVHGHPALPVASTPPTSFLPPSQSHTVTPGRSRTKSLPRSLLAFGLITPQVNEKPPPVPDLPKLHVNSAPAMQSFFDTDSDGDTPNATARVSARPASRRLSAIFASPPNQDELSAPSISSNESTRHLRLHSDSHTSKGPPKLSLTTKLRTKISRSRLSPFASTHPVYPYEEPLPTPALSFSPYSEVPSPMTSASSSFPRSPGSPAFEDARRYDAVRQGRAITPDDDPFRKGDLVYAGENSWNFVQVSPHRRSFQQDGAHEDKRRQMLKSRSTPKLSSRWSSDSDSPSSSPVRSTTPISARSNPRDSLPLPEKQVHGGILFPPSDAISPLSFTFPLPPGAQESMGDLGVTIRVSTPLPGPPPTYPPPRPPPHRPLPPTPSLSPSSKARLGKRGSSPGIRLKRDSAGHARLRRDSDKSLTRPVASLQRQRKRSRTRVIVTVVNSSCSDARPSIQPRRSQPAIVPLSDEAMLKSRRRASPFPFSLDSPMNLEQRIDNIFDILGAGDAEGTGLHFTNPWTDDCCQDDEMVPDSDVEPDFESFSAKKKASIASTASAQSSLSSTTSASTATSFTSATTPLTPATTVSASPSPLVDLGKALELFPKLSPPANAQSAPQVSHEDNAQLSPTQTYHSARSRPVSGSEADVAAHAARLYILQGGALVRNCVPKGIHVTARESVAIGARGWNEFRGLCDKHGDVPILARDDTGADYMKVDVVEILREGITSGVEVLLRVQSVPSSSQDVFDKSGHFHIPGSYPGYPSQSAVFTRRVPRPLSLSIPGALEEGVLPHITSISPIDIPCTTSDWNANSGLGLGALGLEGVPPLASMGWISPPSTSFPSTLSSPPRRGRPLSRVIPEEVPWESQGERRTVLTFQIRTPTTLGELACRAGEMSLQEGVSGHSRTRSSKIWF